MHYTISYIEQFNFFSSIFLMYSHSSATITIISVREVSLSLQAPPLGNHRSIFCLCRFASSEHSYKSKPRLWTCSFNLFNTWKQRTVFWGVRIAEGRVSPLPSSQDVPWNSAVDELPPGPTLLLDIALCFYNTSSPCSFIFYPLPILPAGTAP